MVTGTTTSGFDFSGDEAVLDNMELVDALADLDEGNTLAVSRVCRLLLGSDTRKRLYDHIRAKDGRVPTEALERELTEIIGFFNAQTSTAKKSSPSPA